MANHYSKCFNVEYELYSKISKIHRKDSVDEKLKLLRDVLIKSYCDSGIGIDECKSLSATIITMFKEELDGNYIHIFFKDAFLKSILSEMEIRDFEGIKKYISENGSSVLFHEFENFSEITSYNFCIHIPNEQYGFAIQIGLNDKMELRGLIINNGYTIPCSEWDITSVLKKKDLDDQDKAILLGINTIAYIGCFPECLIDGIPKGIRLENGFKNKKITLTTSEKVVVFDKTGRSVIPHFRRGFFRYYADERYTKMKGKIQFIEATVVNSKNAKTLLSTNKKVKD